MTPILDMVVSNSASGNIIDPSETVLVSDFNDKNILFFITAAGYKSFFFMLTKESHDLKFIGNHPGVIQNLQLFKIQIATAKKFINQIEGSISHG